MTELGFSARTYDKILKLSRAIANLAGAKDILPKQLSLPVDISMVYVNNIFISKHNQFYNTIQFYIRLYNIFTLVRHILGTKLYNYFSLPDAFLNALRNTGLTAYPNPSTLCTSNQALSYSFIL